MCNLVFSAIELNSTLWELFVAPAFWKLFALKIGVWSRILYLDSKVDKLRR